VKVTSCQTGRLSRVLTGHRRTPWVVRFHPRLPYLLASGSLDHEVRLWDARSGQCVARHTFGKPIASLAFHVSAGVLAIACGHKLYMWQYKFPATPPVIVLKTRRSMRAVHFHPHGLPVVLTAEVQDPSPTAELAAALTEHGPYCPGPPPPLRRQGGNAGASGSGAGAAGAAQQHAQQQQQRQAGGTAQAAAHRAHVDAAMASSAQAALRLDDAPPPLHTHATRQQAAAQRTVAAIDNPLGALTLSSQPEPAAGAATAAPAATPAWPRAAAAAAALPPSMVPVGWEVPFPANFPFQVRPAPPAAGADPAVWLNPQLVAAINASVWNIIGEEQPPRVRLRLWRFDAGKPTGELDERSGLALQVSDAVLCSEMGVHFSPCGRHLAATVACRGPLPAPSAEASAAAAAGTAGAMDWSPGRPPAGSPGWPHPPRSALSPPAAATPAPAPAPGGDDAAPAAPSPAPHPHPHPHRPERVVFEVRVFSMEGPRVGGVVAAKRIRAAHCLTSVQFSPAGDHVLLAYGKKHSSLLRSLVADRGALLPMHTILEVYRLADMALARVLPSAEDEINAACFHPAPGGGIAYGTKEGRLRVVAHRRGAAGEAAAGGEPAAGAGAALAAPTPRELQALQEFAVLQQQWMEQHAPGV
jgi:activator-of-BECN1-regulated-autophagy protein 1